MQQFCQTYSDCGVRAIQKNSGYQIIYGSGPGTRSVHVEHDTIFNPPEYAKRIASRLGLPKYINFDNKVSV